MRAFFRRVLCAALVATLAAPATALATAPSRHGVTDPEALAHVDAAGSAFQVGDYDKAAIHLKAAYAVEQRAELLYAWAQVERLAGNYRAAAGLYEAFLEQAPESGSAGEAQAHLVEMRALAGDDPEAPEFPADDAQPPEDDTEPEPDADDGDDDSGSPLEGEWLAPTLLGVGAAVAIAGGVVLFLGRSRVSDSRSAPTEQAYFTEIDSGRQIYYAGAATLGAGGLIMVGGAIRYALVARRGGKPKPKKTQAAAMVTRTGFGLSFCGRF
ncbi:MAG: tetratricopeptide repeat protein [Nannocystales bacterium]